MAKLRWFVCSCICCFEVIPEPLIEHTLWSTESQEKIEVKLRGNITEVVVEVYDHINSLMG